jgi:stearoyl-CoA desaturase (Delta-9 desaturase)
MVEFPSMLKRVPRSMVNWMDNHYQANLIQKKGQANDSTWDFPVAFFLVVLSPIALFWVGWSPVAVGVAVGLYWLRMFGITGVYHRYFSHRTYKTSRFFQFILALLGNSAAQRGPLWWAAHHRHHHKFSDQSEDAHSPIQSGFWNSHMLWWARRKYLATRLDLIKDYAKFPELMFLDRFDSLVPISLLFFCYGLGALLQAKCPWLGTGPWQMVAWGFGVSSVVLFHGVAVINSLAHVIGKKRFESNDTSKNSFVLAVVTMGEGWHNNHHYFANSTRQGFYWWEWDPTFYALWCLSKVGLIWDLKPVPARILEIGRGKGAIQRPIEPGLAETLALSSAPNLPDLRTVAESREGLITDYRGAE